MLDVARAKEERYGALARLRAEFCKIGFVRLQLRAVPRLKFLLVLRVVAEPETKLRRGSYVLHPEIKRRALLGNAARPKPIKRGCSCSDACRREYEIG